MYGMQHTYHPFTLGLLITLLGLQFPLCAHAQIKTDGSVGPAAQSLIGPQYTIPQSLGQLAGGNLFHSFQTFNINTGESANFTTSTAGIANVISRVTGGSASSITGTLRLTAASGTPAFFFINPAGVTFGKGASVDVPGALHISTANSLKFADGELHADLQKTSTLSSAAPEAFGFLGTTRSALVIGDGAGIGVKTGQPITLVSGDITINNGGYVRTNGGDARVVAVGNAQQTVPLTGELTTASGDLHMANGGHIYAPSGNGFDAGNITLSAGNITMDGKDSANPTGIVSSAEKPGNGKAGDVAVTAAQDLKLLNGAAIFSDTFAAGDAGTVTISANSITIDGQGKPTAISSNAHKDSSGQAGGVQVTATQNLTVLNGGSIDSNTFATGDAGTIRVSAKNITLDGQGKVAAISSSAYPDSSGHAGSVEITATQNLSVLNGGNVFSDTHASGNAGTVKVSANDVTIDGQGALTIISSSAYRGSSGKAGNVELTVSQNLSLLNGGHVLSDTFATGDAGMVKVNANDITVDGQGVVTLISSNAGSNSSGKAGSVEVTARENLWVLNGGWIESNTSATGDAGTVKVRATTITLDGKGNDAGISSSAFSGSSGNAGNVDVTAARELKILDRGMIDSVTLAAGNAGTIKVSADDITLDGMGYLAVITSGAFADSSGQTGNVHVSATRSITLRDIATIDATNSATVTNPERISPKQITVTAPRITLEDIGVINTRSTGNIAASNITINTDKLLLDTSHIATIANEGNGGAITVHGNGLLLTNSRITTSVTGTHGNGGDIAIHATALALNTGFIQANTNANEAKGGDVTMDVKALAPSAGNSLFLGGSTPHTFQSGRFGYNVIQAAAPTGLNGEIHTTALTIDISGALAGLSAPKLDVGEMARNPCRISGGSSFSSSGRGGFAPSARRALVPLPTGPGEAARALPATLDNNQQRVSTPLDCGTP